MLCVMLAAFVATTLATASDVRAYSAEIEANVNDTLKRFYRYAPAGRELVQKAAAVLVFPNVVKAGFGIGGEYGEGALRGDGRTLGYYSTASASIGFQIGLQGRSVVILFMTKQSLRNFHARDGWEIGVDGSVTLIDIGAAGEYDSNNFADPIIGFIFDGKGLMYNLTLEGSKITRIQR
jgi:lipid-binding SYLF domain-containing protein